MAKLYCIDRSTQYMESDSPVDSEEEAIKVYKECITKGVTWEELLDYKFPGGAIL